MDAVVRMRAYWATGILVAGILPSLGCKCADDSRLPSRASSGTSAPGLVAKPRRVIGKFDPLDGGIARRFGLQPVARLHRGVEAFRGPGRVRSSRVGEATLSMKWGEETKTFTARIYKRGAPLLVAAESADLGVVLTLPTLAAGTYTRGGEGEKQPNLRVRVGPAASAEHLQSADQVAGVTLTVKLDAPTPDRYLVSGTFEGQVSRDSGQATRRVTAGRVVLRLDPNANATEGILRASGR